MQVLVMGSNQLGLSHTHELLERTKLLMQEVHVLLAVQVLHTGMQARQAGAER
jgi:hypothetical protein